MNTTYTQSNAPALHWWALGLCLGGATFALVIWLVNGMLSFRVRQSMCPVYAATQITAAVLGFIARRQRVAFLSAVASSVQLVVLLLAT